jgi:hypothetical protein
MIYLYHTISRKQEFDRSVRIREFQPHWLKMFEWQEYRAIT